MNRQSLLLGGVICVLLGVILATSYVFAATPEFAHTTPPPAGAVETTVAAEQTWIARMTQEPTYAASLTPYYVEVIARDLARQNMTATAVAVSITPHLEITQTPGSPMVTATCAPAIAVRVLEDASSTLDLRMFDAGLDTFTEIQVGYVDHIEGTCTTTPQPFVTTLVIHVNVEESLTRVTQNQLGDLLAPMLAVLADFILPDDLGIRPIYLRVIMVGEDQTIFLEPDYYRARQAHEQGLTGAELMAYLRGPL
jgi:hypothetical protein